MARHARHRGDFEEAVKLFERASSLRPDDFQAPAFMAQALESLGMSRARAAGTASPGDQADSTTSSSSTPMMLARATSGDRSRQAR